MTTRRQCLLAAVPTAASTGVAGFAPRSGPQRLTVAAYPLIDQILHETLPAWRQRHPGIAVDVVSKQYSDHHTAMTTALSTSGHLPDVIALEASFLGRYALGAGLEDLTQPPYNAESLRSAFVPFAFDQGRNRQGAVVALPTDIGPGTLLYRHDLLERAGVQVQELTASWESYVAAGVRIKKATGAYLLGHAQTLKDIITRGSVKAGDGLYFDSQQRVQVRSPRFVRAFELARQLRRQGLDGRMEAWTGDWAEGLKRGLLATELSGAWMVGQLANWVAPNTRGLWRVAQLPENTFVAYGGTYYAIPRRAKPENKALAWSLIQDLTLNRNRQLQSFRSQDAFPALLSAHEDPFFDEPLPFLGGQRARLIWRDAARRITAAKLHKQNRFADEVIKGELDNVLAFGKDIRQSLADAEDVLALRATR